MTHYPVKIWVKKPGEPKVTEERGRAARELIKKHGGKDASSGRPTAAFVVGVFTDKAAAKAFRNEARARIEG